MQRLEGDLVARQRQLDKVQEQLQEAAAEKLEAEGAATLQCAELDDRIRSTELESAILQVGDMMTLLYWLSC